MEYVSAFPELDLTRGFLPPKDPVTKLPERLRELDLLGTSLPDLINSGRTRQVLDEMPVFDIEGLSGEEVERVFLIASFLASAYIYFPGESVASRLPPGLSVLLHRCSKLTGRPPIMSYASYALYNWRRLDVSRPIELGNLELLQKFNGIRDEAWFILVHVEIENTAGPALRALLRSAGAIRDGDIDAVVDCLSDITQTLTKMLGTLRRMPEHCSPDVYYHSVRPYLFSFKNVAYEGVKEWKGRRRTFLRGETGAQSSIIPSCDVGLGIRHEETALTKHTRTMRYYMPPLHRDFIRLIAAGPSMRKFVQARKDSEKQLVAHHNEAVAAVADFRKGHYQDATDYIHDRVKNPEGSGGTDFMNWLKQQIDETEAHIIR